MKSLCSWLIIFLKLSLLLLLLLKIKSDGERFMKRTDQSNRSLSYCPFLQHYFYSCIERVKNVRQTLNTHKCVEINGVVVSDCSIYQYLAKIGPVCRGTKELNKRKISLKANIRDNLNGIIEIFADKSYSWMRERIKSLNPDWITGITNFTSNYPLYRRKNILAFMGAFSKSPNFFEYAGKGGPLGELIQWTDLVTALYVLGHNVCVAKTTSEMLQIMNSVCPTRTDEQNIDVIYTDIVGVWVLKRELGEIIFSQYKCKLRVLDSFGTYPEFNYPDYPNVIPGRRSVWGNLNLFLSQFLTFFPHTHDNRFLGFIISSTNTPSHTKKKKQALLYAKQAMYIQRHEYFLSVISQYFEIHATCILDFPLPPFVHNHGLVSPEKYQELLAESKLLIGVGFPYEGPGALDAMANGAAFLQPKFDVPISRLNTDFFSAKPTLRQLSSQNPYMEEYIGEPYCYTINVTDEVDLRKTLYKIKSMDLLPKKIPNVFTTESFLKRVHDFTDKMDFCDPYAKRWPPLENLRIFVSIQGESCKDACWSRGFLCERTYFDDINRISLLQEHSKVHCDDVKEQMVLHAPSVNQTSNVCFIQAHGQVFSCMHGQHGITRLCPCMKS